MEKMNVTGAEAFKYIRGELSKGRLLSSLINRLDIESGSVYSLVPPAVPHNKLYDFKNGGVYPIEQPIDGQYWVPVQNDAGPILVKEILSDLKANKENCCFFEEPILELSDDKINTLNLEYVYLATGQIYYFFKSEDADIEKIKHAIGVSEDYVFLCALSRIKFTSRNALLPMKEISEDILMDFASNVHSFFIRAYDGEGYLTWNKT